MNKFIEKQKFASLIILGVFLTSSQIYSQHVDLNPHDQFLQRKIVRKDYNKTFKRAEKFLTKDIRKFRRNGTFQKEITPLEWWKQEYLMTMDPQVGRPTPEFLLPTFRSLNQKPIKIS